MRVWIVSDTHFGVKNDDHQWLETFTEYFNETVIPLFKREVREDDILVHLGDVFDNRKFAGLKTISTVIDIFEQLSGIFNEIKIIVGNHDIFNKNSNDITSNDVLKHIPNVKIYKEPIAEMLGTKKCLFMPWQSTVDLQQNVLEKYSGNSYVFCHSEILGADMGKGNESKSDTAIDKKFFEKAQVYSGHIHLRSNRGNIHYVGAPYHLTRTDIGHEKGITLLDIESGETTFFENTVSPKFVEITLKPNVKFDIDKNMETIKNNFVDIFVNQSDVAKINVSDISQKISEYAKSVNLSINDDIKLNESIIEEVDKGKTISNHIDDYIVKVTEQFELEQDQVDYITKYVNTLKSKFNE